MNLKLGIAPAKTRIMLVDDHPVVRQGLTRLINDEPDLTVCCEADSAATALEAAERCAPDLALVDISLGGADGLELIKTLCARMPNMMTLVLSMHDESLYAERVLRLGAKGYVAKQEAPETVMVAIRQVMGGEVYVSAKMAAKLLKSMSGARNKKSGSPLDRLSNRELQVFRMIGAGLNVRTIAERLELSVKTVETHRDHAKEKLSLNSSAELLRYAVQYRIDTT